MPVTNRARIGPTRVPQYQTEPRSIPESSPVCHRIRRP